MFCGAASFAHCGTASFAHVDQDSPPSTPKGASRRKHGGDSNPYAARGLEKFSLVLADLESRREKIMATAGSQGVAFVRFVYDNSQDWVPIVVRRREQRPELEKKMEKGRAAEAQQKPDAPAEQQQAPPCHTAERASAEGAKKGLFGKLWEGKGGSGIMQLLRWRDSYYWPALLVLILLCLAVFGRAFAICCTCIWWYLVPAMKAGEGHNVRRPRKKEYARRMSDRRLGSGGDEVAVSAAGKKAVGAVDGPASPRVHHAAGKRG